jgi:hypothetical protein
MQCPREGCGGKSEVLRTTAQGFVLRRRRRCLKCGVRFTTRETIEARPEPAEGAEQSFPQRPAVARPPTPSGETRVVLLRPGERLHIIAAGV